MVISRDKAQEIVRKIEARRKKGTKNNERFEKPVEKVVVEVKNEIDDVVKTPPKKVKKTDATI
jgi:hypothetical protein